MSKVLIVEDSPVQASALSSLLEEHGLKVHHSPDGQSGVDMARLWTPDVIVLDVNMPDMDGFEVCRRLQGDSETSRIPIIMLTANNNPSTLTRSISLGAIDFIPKDGLTNVVLIETLRQLHVLTESRLPGSGGLE